MLMGFVRSVLSSLIFIKFDAGDGFFFLPLNFVEEMWTHLKLSNSGILVSFEYFPPNKYTFVVFCLYEFRPNDGIFLLFALVAFRRLALFAAGDAVRRAGVLLAGGTGRSAGGSRRRRRCRRGHVERLDLCLVQQLHDLQRGDRPEPVRKFAQDFADVQAERAVLVQADRVVHVVVVLDGAVEVKVGHGVGFVHVEPADAAGVESLPFGGATAAVRDFHVGGRNG